MESTEGARFATDDGKKEKKMEVVAAPGLCLGLGYGNKDGGEGWAVVTQKNRCRVLSISIGSGDVESLVYERKLSKKLIELTALEPLTTIVLVSTTNVSFLGHKHQDVEGHAQARLSKWPLSNITHDEDDDEDHNGHNDDGR